MLHVGVHPGSTGRVCTNISLTLKYFKLNISGNISPVNISLSASREWFGCNILPALTSTSAPSRGGVGVELAAVSQAGSKMQDILSITINTVSTQHSTQLPQQTRDQTQD